MAEVPAAPWTLEGRMGFAIAGLIPIDRVRSQVPSDLEIVSIVPGFTLQVLAAARYEAGSTLEYSELLVVPAVVRVPEGIGMYPSVLYVDDDTSRRGGQSIWGLNKELAEFTWEERSEPRGGTSYELAVRRAGEPLLNCWWMPRWVGPSLRLPLPVVSLLEGRPRLWRAMADAKVRLASRHLEVSGNGLSKMVPTVGSAFHLSDLTLTVPAP